RVDGGGVVETFSGRMRIHSGAESTCPDPAEEGRAGAGRPEPGPVARPGACTVMFIVARGGTSSVLRTGCAEPATAGSEKRSGRSRPMRTRLAHHAQRSVCRSTIFTPRPGRSVHRQ